MGCLWIRQDVAGFLPVFLNSVFRETGSVTERRCISPCAVRAGCRMPPVGLRLRRSASRTRRHDHRAGFHFALRCAGRVPHAPAGLRLRRSASRTALRLLVPPGGNLFGCLVSRRSWRNPRRRNSPGGGTPLPARKEQGHKSHRGLSPSGARRKKTGASRRLSGMGEINPGFWRQRPSSPRSRSFPDTSGARCDNRCSRHAPTRHRSAAGHRPWSGAWRHCWC